jgi:hypothetical protein
MSLPNLAPRPASRMKDPGFKAGVFFISITHHAGHIVVKTRGLKTAKSIGGMPCLPNRRLFISWGSKPALTAVKQYLRPRPRMLKPTASVIAGPVTCAGIGLRPKRSLSRKRQHSALSSNLKRAAPAKLPYVGHVHDTQRVGRRATSPPQIASVIPPRAENIRPDVIDCVDNPRH